MAQGYIKLYRSLMENSIWTNEPFSRGQAWVDILLLTNHTDNQLVFDGTLIDVKRGSFITSIRKLCERWQWSNTKVTRFLKLLKQCNMIDYFSDAKKTVITVTNWDLYQSSNDAETTQKRRRNDAETTQKHTNNNDKNDKNILLNNIPPYNPPKEPTTVNQFIKSLDRSEKFKSAFKDFADMRRTIKHPLTVRAAQMILNKLDKLSCNEQEQIDILNQSIEHSWQGVFALKDKQNKSIPDYSGSKDFFGR